MFFVRLVPKTKKINGTFVCLVPENMSFYRFGPEKNGAKVTGTKVTENSFDVK